MNFNRIIILITSWGMTIYFFYCLVKDFKEKKWGWNWKTFPWKPRMRKDNYNTASYQAFQGLLLFLFIAIYATLLYSGIIKK